MKINAINTTGGGRDSVAVLMEGGEELRLSREVLMRAGLSVGDQVEVIQLQALVHEDLLWRAREAALRLLAHRPRTESELRQRLLRKDFPADVVEETVRALREKRLLDDAEFAEMFARDRVRLNPRGRRRVVQELRGRGVEADVASAAVDGVMQEESVDELALARDASRRWRPRESEEPARARQRLMGYLARRGFGAEAVRQVVAEVLGED